MIFREHIKNGSSMGPAQKASRNFLYSHKKVAGLFFFFKYMDTQ